MLKNNYRKIGKKKDNDIDADVAQREYSTLNAMLKVKESVNVKKNEYNLIYLNLNKILYV